MFGTKCPEVVKAGERRKAAPRRCRQDLGAVKIYAQNCLQAPAE